MGIKIPLTLVSESVNYNTCPLQSYDMCLSLQEKLKAHIAPRSETFLPKSPSVCPPTVPESQTPLTVLPT